MTEYVLGPEYAERLVQRARDGMTWELLRGDLMDLGWSPAEPLDYWYDGQHWTVWYRETYASTRVAVGLAPFFDHWASAFRELSKMLLAFENALDAICPLCPSPVDLRHYPTEWTT